MKSFTDIEQSKKLAEILPVDSADMCYRPYREEGGIPDYLATLCPYKFASWLGVPCWSLAALLEIIPEVLVERRIPDGWDCVSYAECQMTSANNFENLIDACVEVIIKLHEEKLL